MSDRVTLYKDGHEPREERRWALPAWEAKGWSTTKGAAVKAARAEASSDAPKEK